MKTTLLAIIILIVNMSFTMNPETGPSKTGRLAGVITFKDSYTAPVRADAGSEVYIVSETDARSTQYDGFPLVMESFQAAKSEYYLSLNNTLDPGSTKRSRDLFDSRSAYTSQYIDGFRHSPVVSKIECNAKGQYSLSLGPGRYYILAISAAVKSNNVAELKGNLDYSVVEVKSTGETIRNFGFEKHEIIWFRLITASQRGGC